MKNSMNLYWPIYKRLEEEVVKLAFSIHFNDDQINVYSTHIADLIVRCVVEIEALSKKLYEQLGGNMQPIDAAGNVRELYFDTDCMALLNQHWHLDKKRIAISASNFYFEKGDNKLLFPLHKSDKRGSSGSKWKQAYQALKHDRYKNLKKATIGNLINALGSLYILNVYYKDEYFYLGSAAISPIDFNSACGSDIFSAKIFNALSFDWKEEADDGCIKVVEGDNLDWAIYVLKHMDRDFKNLHLNWCVEQKWTEKNFKENNTVQIYLMKHPEMKEKTIKEICLAAGGERLYDNIKSRYRKHALSFPYQEAKLNKDNRVYPSLGKCTEDEIKREFYKTEAYEKHRVFADKYYS